MNIEQTGRPRFIKPSPTEMMEALTRSGYLMESEIGRLLRKEGFITEANQVMLDPITGRNREIDLQAEQWGRAMDNEEISNYNLIANTRFIFEMKNNTYPLVLLSRWDDSPNIDSSRGLKHALTVPGSLRQLYSYYESYNEELIDKNKNLIFTQYCSFERKNSKAGELMATHPELLNEGLSKITQRCEELAEAMDEYFVDVEHPTKDNYLRHFLYMPIVLINDDLYILKTKSLQKVNMAILTSNYHYKKEEKFAFVFVLTKKALLPFVKKQMGIDVEIEKRMLDIRKNREGFKPKVKEPLPF